jgi:hypothetical protein
MAILTTANKIISVKNAAVNSSKVHNISARIGLYSMEGVTMVAYDNFKVWQVTAKRTR